MPTMKTDNPSLRPVAGFGRAGPIRPDQKATPDKAMGGHEIRKPGLEVTNETRKQTAVSEGLPPASEGPSLRPPLLRRREASNYLKEEHGIPVAPATLAGMARYGDGPDFHRFRGIPLYPRDELDRWAKAQLGPLRAQHPQR